MTQRIARALILGGALLSLLNGTAIAQTSSTAKPPGEFSAGLIVPVSFNHPFSTGQDISDSGTRTTLGLWAEAVGFVSPVIALHTGVEFPRAYTTTDRHFGSGGFFSTMHHSDVVVYETVGFHSHRPTRVQVAGLVGFGVVFSNTVEDGTNLAPGSTAYGTALTSAHSQIEPALLGGMDVPVAISDNVSIVMRVRGRVTMRRDSHSIEDEILGRLALIPGVGVNLKFK